MDLVQLVAIIFRLGIMVVVYFYIWFYFFKRYRKSKQDGFPNPFFMGFSLLFMILIIVHVLYGSYELYNALGGSLDLRDYFPNAPTDVPQYIGWILPQLRPLFMFFYGVMNIVIASLVYPLEKAVGWKKTPFTYLLFCGAIAEALLFVPAIRYTILGFICVNLGFIGIGFGFILNILVNAKLFKDSTGAIRTRSLYAIFAFLLMGLGLVLSLEVGWLTQLSDALTYKHEIIVGSIMQIIGVIFYRLGFAQEGLTAD